MATSVSTKPSAVLFLSLWLLLIHIETASACNGDEANEHICSACDPECLVCVPAFIKQADCGSCECRYVWWWYPLILVCVLLLLCIAACILITCYLRDRYELKFISSSELDVDSNRERSLENIVESLREHSRYASTSLAKLKPPKPSLYSPTSHRKTMSSAYYQEVPFAFDPDSAIDDLEFVSHDSLPRQSGRLDSVDEVYPHLVRISSTFGLQLLDEEGIDAGSGRSSETSLAQGDTPPDSCVRYDDDDDDDDDCDEEDELKQMEIATTDGDTGTTTATFSDRGSVRVHVYATQIQSPAAVPKYTFPVHSYRTEANKLGNISDEQWNAVEVAIVTQCSVDRLPQLSAMANHWKDGIISVALYVKADDDVDAIRQKFNTDWSRSTRMQIHLVYANEVDSSSGSGDGDCSWYPINYLRNVALTHCRCRFVFLVDIDFMPCRNLYAMIAANLPRANECLVVPAFEWLHKSDYAAESSDLFELSKPQLIAKYKSGSIQPFQMDYFPAGHSPTNYDKWMQTGDDGGGDDGDDDEAGDGLYEQVYRVPYTHHYEPYIVVRNGDHLCRYDERFTGYGMNKIVHIAQLAMQNNFKFNVLCAGYIIALQHEKSDDFRRTLQSKTNNRRKWLRALFNTAMHEIKNGVASNEL